MYNRNNNKGNQVSRKKCDLFFLQSLTDFRILFEPVGYILILLITDLTIREYESILLAITSDHLKILCDKFFFLSKIVFSPLKSIKVVI